MDKELINTLSDLFDEKLKPINDRFDMLEEKLNLIQQQINVNAENIEDLKDTVSHIEYTITKNKLDNIRLRNLEKMNRDDVDLKSIVQIVKRIEYKINRLDNDIISIKCKLRKLE